VLVGAEPKEFAPFGPQYEKSRGDGKDVPFTIGNYCLMPRHLRLHSKSDAAKAAGSLKPDQVYSLRPFSWRRTDYRPERRYRCHDITCRGHARA